MTSIFEVLSGDALDEQINEGFIRVRMHPDDPLLHILNYTEKAQFAKHWTPETMACRGLIVRWYDDGSDAQIVARPWSKFFNYGEHPEGTLDLDAFVEVTDKQDGSLGIMYKAPDGDWAIATRGSFTSEQAIHATEVLRTRYRNFLDYDREDDVTYLFEIVYPGNRIVLDYGTQDDLVLLGVVSTETGFVYSPYEVSDNWGWYGPITPRLEATTLREALALPPRKNAEGVVVRFVQGVAQDVMVKIKQEDYVALHRLVTGLSEKSVWEHLSTHDGDPVDLLLSVPDEFHEWVSTVAARLVDEFWAIKSKARQDFHWVRTCDVDGVLDRKTFAERAKTQTYPNLMFRMLDGNEVDSVVWKMIKPVGQTPMKRTSEDTA